MTTLLQISTNQSNKETTMNEALGAVSPAGIFGKKHTTTTGLVFGWYGGQLIVDGVLTLIADSTVALTASVTNYVEATRAGVVTKNTSGFSAGQIPLWELVTNVSAITGFTDRRAWVQPNWVGSFLSKAYPSDANYTLNAAEARARIIKMTGTLTVQRNLVVPLFGDWLVQNSTTGGFGVQVIGATGTGIVIASTKQAFVYGDGTNIIRATADQ